MDFFEHLQKAAELAEKQGFSLKVSLEPLGSIGSSAPQQMHPVLSAVMSSSTEKGDVAVAVSPLIDKALEIHGAEKTDSTISEDIVFEIFELIRTETELLLPDYEQLKSQFGARVLHTSIARIIAEKLGLRNKGKRVIVDNKEALIGSYTQIHR